ncbi:DUF3592 domain-containing protein [Burkholderia latens]|uniref:hypothetical protein n=1 Tax=Burkholderia latens TaxID=488446 RepID=UPI0039A734E2
MKSLLRAVVGCVAVTVFVWGFFRVAYALQRIDPATVVATGAECAAAGLGPASRSCSFPAALAGRLAGGWSVRPAVPGAREFVSSNVTIAYSRDAWRLAYGGIYVMPGVLVVILSAVLAPMLVSVRRLSNRS